MAKLLKRSIAALVVAALSAPALAGAVGAAGDVYVSDGYAGGLYQYDAATGDLVGLFASRGNRIFAAQAWGPDGNLYAVTTQNFNRWDVDKFDGTTGQWLGSVVSHLNDGSPSAGKGITFTADGDLIVGDWFRGEISRYSAGTFALETTYSATTGDNLGTPSYMAVSPTGSLMVVSSGYNKVLEFNISDGGVDLVGDFATIAGVSQPQDVLFTDHGTMLVSGGYTGIIAEFDASSGAFIRNLVSDATLSPLGMAIDAQGRLLVAVGGGGNANDYGIVMYDVNSGAFLGDFSTYPNGQAGLDGSPIYITLKPIPAPGGLLLVPAAACTMWRRRR